MSREHADPAEDPLHGGSSIFGSIIAFTSFVLTLRSLPTNIAMTYAYMNPVVAVILGHLILGEPITRWTVAGSALVILGVAGVFQERRVGSRAAERARLQSKMAALEPLTECRGRPLNDVGRAL